MASESLASPIRRRQSAQRLISPSPTCQNQFELGAVRNKIGYFGSWSGGGLHIVYLTNPAFARLFLPHRRNHGQCDQRLLIGFTRFGSNVISFTRRPTFPES